MKRIILLYLIFFTTRLLNGQVYPYIGGDGSGYHANQSATTICPPYFGGGGDGYDMDSTDCSILLPIKLLEFYGERESNRNILHWKISDGFNVKQFNIERSVDGILFTQIGIVAGSINFNQPYLFINNTPDTDINFYRLRITELDNIVSYSKVLVIKNLSKTLLSLYPNPASTSATLYYYSSRAGVTTLMLYQYDGREVMTKILNLKRGANYINLDFQNMGDGLYFMRIGENGSQIKIIVQKK